MDEARGRGVEVAGRSVASDEQDAVGAVDRDLSACGGGQVRRLQRETPAAVERGRVRGRAQQIATGKPRRAALQKDGVLAKEAKQVARGGDDVAARHVVGHAAHLRAEHERGGSVDAAEVIRARQHARLSVEADDVVGLQGDGVGRRCRDYVGAVEREVVSGRFYELEPRVEHDAVARVDGDHVAAHSDDIRVDVRLQVDGVLAEDADHVAGVEEHVLARVKQDGVAATHRDIV